MGRPGGSASARATTSSTSPQSHVSREVGVTARRRGSRATPRSRRSRTSSSASSSRVPPREHELLSWWGLPRVVRRGSGAQRFIVKRALSPSGLILVDKPAGPSSFAIVAEMRRRTGARTGHAGTLDPFATGLLILLSGAATKLASCFVGLDKRYVTDVDLRARTSTGDPEGQVVEHLEPPSPDELTDRLAPLRGEIELPLPAASAVKIGGERAYKLARRGVAVEMPLRRSRVDALDVITYESGVARLDLRVTSGTYVRAIADALGGHCRTLRRLEIGPFSVEEADPQRMISPDDAMARLR